jgi:hypothetical protein
MDIQVDLQRQSPPMSGAARWGRIAFIGLNGLFLLAIVIQVFLAGMSIFFAATWWQAHMTMAFFIEWLPVVMIAFAFVGRLPRAFALASVLLLGLIMLQYVFVEVAAHTGVRWIAAFHPVNALVISAVALRLFQKVRSYLR